MSKIKNTKSNQNKKKNSSNNVSKIKVYDLLNDKQYKKAEKLYKSKNYEESYREYLLLCEKYPKNKKIYKRLIETLTENYTVKYNDKEFKTAFDDYITTYKLLATKKELKYFENKLEEFKSIKVTGSRSKFLLITFLGIFGVHKFIERKYIIGILYLLTLGFFGIGVIVDLINDYAEYEDDFKLNIVRYIISLIIIILGLLKYNDNNFYYIVLIGIIFMPIIYSKLLKLIPNIIKIVGIVVLLFFGLKNDPIIYNVPNKALGVWKTNNENTNFKEIDINLNNSTIKFNDRDKETGYNEYDKEKNILKVHVDATKLYKFKLDLDNNIICIYNESNRCVISFEK